MSTPEQRRQMAAAIVDLEARRDAEGHLMIYRLPTGDGGGAKNSVANITEIFRARTRVQVVQQTVIALQRLKLSYFAVRIVQIPKSNCLSRAHLLARGLDLAVPDAAEDTGDARSLRA